ncbi:hypothetical protein [Luteibacter sp. 3190]|uniref:hypothetical protein n=1 Tax=Luteibacter sp. 3190 TaxID=2817736 RepID=UPI00285C47AC|nr:hypothetical protein [Luteibacter sp. 3190]MDR6935963.1 hypothetical protein [Luteibacter sp. 3190]
MVARIRKDIRILYIDFDPANDSSRGEGLVAVLNHPPSALWRVRFLRAIAMNDACASLLAAVQVKKRSIRFVALGERSLTAIAQLGLLVEATNVANAERSVVPATMTVDPPFGAYAGRRIGRRLRRWAVHAAST